MTKPTTSAANAAPKQRGRPFEPGRSGNPAGKLPGTRNRASVMLDAIEESDLQAIVAKIVEQAKGGDLAAAKLIFDRVAPAPRARAVAIDLAKVGRHDGGNAILESYAAIVRGVAGGEVSPAEGLELADLLDRQRRAIADLKPGRLKPEPTPEQAAAELAERRRLADQIDRIGLGRF